MESTNKITQEQLDTIRNQQNDVNSFLSNIGLLETKKHSLLHQLTEVNKNVEEFKALLQEQYGSITINIEDGSYIENEEEVKPEEVQ